MTYTYVLDVTPLYEPKIFDRWLRRISKSRREKSLSYINLSDRCLCLGASVLLLWGFNKLWGLNEAEVEYGFTSAAKPYIADSKDVHFNVSHSGIYAAAVFSDAPVGIDIEKYNFYDGDILSQLFSESEQSYINGFDGQEDKSRTFTRLWVIKECFQKATGHGMSLPLSDFSVYSLISGQQKSVLFENEHYYFNEFELPLYNAAICSSRNDFKALHKICLEEIQKIY